MAAIATKKKGSSVSTDQGVPLAPSKEDLRPWYSSKTGERSTEDGRKDKDDAEGKRYVFTCVHWVGSGAHVSFDKPPRCGSENGPRPSHIY